MNMKNSELAESFAHGEIKGSASNMFIEGDVMYSYGYHFALAIRKRGHFVLNGDTYSSSTSTHQTYTREACEPNVTIPFSVLMTALNEHNSNNALAEKAQQMKILDTQDDEYRDVPYIDKETGEHKIRQEHMLGAVLFEFEKKYFLSATDSRAKGFRLGYFMVELPKKVTNIDEALKTLMPAGIKNGIPYERQGEFFFVPCYEKTPRLHAPETQYEWMLYNYKTHDVISRNESTRLRERFRNEEDAETTRKALESNVYRQNNNWSVHKRPRNDLMNIAIYFETGSQNSHLADELAMDSKKRLYARGNIIHPEHKRLKLGKVWHRVYVNRAVRSIGASGRID